MSGPLLHLDEVSTTNWRGAHALPVLQDVSMKIAAGEVVAVQGARRVGKTTLLSVAAGLVPADDGTVRFAGVDLDELSCGSHAELLSERIAWARCGETLPDDLRAVEHVVTPLLPRTARRAAERRAAAALALVGAERTAAVTWDRLDDFARTLVTIARALAREPELVLLDDPLVGLRAPECERVVELLRERAERTGLAVLMTVGERPAARRAHRIWTLRDGHLIPPPAPPDGGGRVIELPLPR